MVLILGQDSSPIRETPSSETSQFWNIPSYVSLSNQCIFLKKSSSKESNAEGCDTSCRGNKKQWGNLLMAYGEKAARDPRRDQCVRQGPSLKLELAGLARVAGQQAPGIPVCLCTGIPSTHNHIQDEGLAVHHCQVLVTFSEPLCKQNFSNFYLSF